MSRRPQRQRPEPTSPLRPEVERPYLGGELPEQQTPGVTDSQTPGVPEGETPRYLQLVRKEARLRPDQLSALADLRRTLIRSRVDRAEVLTDNTLIRVAVDLLLDQAHALHGDTEAALRQAALRAVRPTPGVLE